jgi:hypothetical protein
MPIITVEERNYEGNSLEDENYSDKLVKPMFLKEDSFI